MDHFKVKETLTDRNGNRKSLALHGRIEKFTEKYSEEGELLMPIKWLGNSGSQAGEPLTQDDTLDGMDIFEHVVNKSFETDSKRIAKLDKIINKKKGPVKRI